MKLNFSLDTAIIITLVSVLLYMVGQVYLNATLTPFGGEAVVLNFSIQDKLYYGYLQTVGHWILLVFVAIIIFIGIPILSKELKVNAKINSFFKKIGNKNKIKNYPPIHNSSLESSFDQTIDSRITSLYSILFFLIFSLFYLAHLEKSTETHSQEIITTFPANLSKVEFKDNKAANSYKLLCGQTLCAVVRKSDNGDINLNYVDPKDITITKVKNEPSKAP